jgi:hypothetical protein
VSVRTTPQLRRPDRRQPLAVVSPTVVIVDPLTCLIEDLPDTRVLASLLGGRTVAGQDLVT